ncbi:hypothetical protein [Janthinobacterium sp. PSPC3-1]|uniref:hypothetical protein n=1 Tax=Janthinobacterium sp. PSPC3-1 TaxID=2804653 RepID=UPI003CE67D77
MSSDYFNPNNHFAEQAKLNEQRARLEEIAARRELDAEKFRNQSNDSLIAQLRDKASVLAEKNHQLQRANAQLETDNKFLESLLSLPMDEIAAKNPRFKASHDAQQLALAKWILSQKAYAETAFVVGIAAGKNAEEILAIYKDSVSSVLANATKHNNNAVGNPVLKAHADSIIKRN